MFLAAAFYTIIMTVKSDRENIEEGMNCCIEKIMFKLLWIAQKLPTLAAG